MVSQPLDRTEQRILGVLMEKQLAVPDSYPMTENALLAGCNQKSNRDPEMALESFELAGALMALCEKGWVTKTEGGRAARYRHEVDGKLGVSAREKAVLTELLVRGPQAPGALKPRVARMGFAGTPAEIEAALVGLRERAGDALVEQQARRPRERDARWAHLLGPQDAAHAAPAGDGDSEVAPRPAAPAVSSAPAPAPSNLELRLAQLESEVGAMREELDELRDQLGGNTGSGAHG